MNTGKQFNGKWSWAMALMGLLLCVALQTAVPVAPAFGGTAGIYSLEVGGTIVGYFNAVSGIGSEHEIVEQRIIDPATGKETIRKIPGRLKWSNITLSRGITNDPYLWTWRREVENGAAQIRRNCSIVLLDETGRELARWDLINAWPSKILAPDNPSPTDPTPFESLTLVHEGYVRN